MNIIPMTKTELVVICFMFKGGQWVQDKKLQIDYAMQQIKSGTADFTSDVLTDKLDGYGATLSTGTCLTHSYIQLTCLRRMLPQTLPLLCNIITSPVYEQAQLDNAIEEGVLAYQMNEQKVAQASRRTFYQQLLGKDHPASAYADESDYHSICREDLLSYHRKYIQLNNATIYTTGRIDSDVISLIDKYIGTIPTTKRKCFEFQHADIITSQQMMHETAIAVPSVQSGLRMGKVMPDCHSEDYPAIMLTSTILGGYFGSRLMKNIREKLGFTYGIHSTFFNIPSNNIFFITTETTREHVTQCVSEITKEIIDLREKPVSMEELENARNYNLGQFCRATETSLTLHHLLMNLQVHQRTLENIQQEQEKSLKLTPEDIMSCAQKYFSPESMLIVAAHGNTPCDAL
ncbi:MAG: insulinase family protein [Bacteroidaceae bacterium]|nr:insulinase family protein [Bacteroidaceae bacterium]